ncbi:hypothetical protein GCM10022226_28790 [Sphaerisporangium flaviroseum]|uniref:Glycosyltransferase RgtA/B/C/D-like domain-containing protein n=1 Tax=Sphaerisporangium flaviroseum TaxID=509199 RepID=A0ABP7HXR7_9ACTN
MAGSRKGEAGRPRVGRLWSRRPLWTSRVLGHPAAPLAFVAALYGLAQLAFVGNGLRWGWDEMVYLSQVSPSLPDAAFTAPRARGITWLVAPVAFFSASPSVVRLWMTLLSSTGLFVAYLPWLRVLAHRGHPAVVALAALLFAGLWVVQYYGGAVMPNLYVAYASVAATAFFLLAVRDPRAAGDPDVAASSRTAQGPLLGLAAGVAVAALLRPGDAVWLVLALGLAWPAVRAWRRAAVLPALVGGLALGLAPWIVEAYTRYGGLLHRVHEASRIQGTLRPTWGVLHEFTALNGPLLCRPCDIPVKYPYLVLWWLVLPFAAAGGVLVARRIGVAGPYGLACAAGAGLAAQYLFLVGYGAPRFLLPAYALLALPVALLLVRLAWSRRSAAVVVGTAVAGQLVTQHLILDRRVERSHAYRAGERAVAETLRRSGLSAPCVVGGPAATLPMAYEAGCGFRTFRRKALTRPDERMAAYVTRVPEAAVAGWVSRSLRTADGRMWYLWLPAVRAGENAETARPKPRGFAGSVPRVGFEPTLYGF